MARTRIRRPVLLATATALVTAGVALSTGALSVDALSAPVAPRPGLAAAAVVSDGGSGGDADGGGVLVRKDLLSMPRWGVTQVFEVRSYV
ncbi:hypothetical protein [Streptomyces avidinii]|uniref:Uncharacterized protein n=1 Tax=Streptomyces avidinii TaxID=1895 RepID=A0ABS4L4U9_STRAV|nr:hypothetical protein [Streptomyces avidinii]MBP2037110.1 hypothetical protein [Streptomyces avidinii]GGY95253.1 hypothetical protein GCM10010343_20880 [Streptomyces avidinii]